MLYHKTLAPMMRLVLTHASTRTLLLITIITLDAVISLVSYDLYH